MPREILNGINNSENATAKAVDEKNLTGWYLDANKRGVGYLNIPRLGIRKYSDGREEKLDSSSQSPPRAS